jgi:hypothetical protein
MFIDAPLGRAAVVSFASEAVVRLVGSDVDEAIYARSYSLIILLTMILPCDLDLVPPLPANDL